MKHGLALLAVLLLLTPAAAPAASTAVDAHACDGEDKLPHPPIIVQGNVGPMGFALAHDPVTGAPVYRPGSGVVAGAGTVDDPYVISGWCVPEVALLDADAHVRVTNVRVTHADPTIDAAVSVHGARNAAFEDVLVDARSARVGVRVVDARNVTFTGLSVQAPDVGFDLSLVTGAVVNGSDLTARTGIALRDGEGNRVEENDVHGADTGILVTGSDGNVVDANRVHDAETAIRLTDGTGNRVTGNTVTGGELGVVASHAHDGVVDGNTVSGVHVGVLVQNAHGTRVTGNAVNASRVDAHLWESHGITVAGNAFHASGLRITASTPAALVHDVPDSNTVGGRPILYLDGAEDALVTGDVGQVIAVRARNVTVANATFTGTVMGVHAAHVDGLTVADSAFTGNGVGAFVAQSTNVTIARNHVNDGTAGFIVHDVAAARVDGNAVENVTRDGLSFGGAVDARVTGNAVTGAHFGITLLGSDGARVTGNDFTGNYAGARVFFSHDAALNGNNVHGNAEAGLVVWSLTEIPALVDATRNWWGCADGPEAPACDGIRTLQGPEPAFEPWLTAPVD